MGFREDVRRAKAFTDESRLAILLALQDGEKCGCSLMELLKISQPTLSHHMKILCDSDLVAVVLGFFGKAKEILLFFSLSRYSELNHT